MDYIEILKNSLAYKLNQAHRRVQEHYKQQLDKLGLTPAQVYALCVLKDKKLALPSEIAEYLKISRPSMTTLLDRMQRDKLIQRLPDKLNRRRVWIVATNKGISLMEKAHQGLQRAEGALNYSGAIDIEKLKTKLDNLTNEITSTKERSNRLGIGSIGSARA